MPNELYLDGGTAASDVPLHASGRLGSRLRKVKSHSQLSTVNKQESQERLRTLRLAAVPFLFQVVVARSWIHPCLFLQPVPLDCFSFFFKELCHHDGFRLCLGCQIYSWHSRSRFPLVTFLTPVPMQCLVPSCVAFLLHIISVCS